MPIWKAKYLFLIGLSVCSIFSNYSWCFITFKVIVWTFDASDGVWCVGSVRQWVASYKDYLKHPQKVCNYLCVTTRYYFQFYIYMDSQSPFLHCDRLGTLLNFGQSLSFQSFQFLLSTNCFRARLLSRKEKTLIRSN